VEVGVVALLVNVVEVLLTNPTGWLLGVELEFNACTGRRSV